MKRISKLYLLKTSVLLFGAGILAAGWLSACSDGDDNQPLNPEQTYIDIVDYPDTGYSIKAVGTSITGEALTIHAKGLWQFVPENDNTSEWLRLFPDRGNDDGVLRVIAIENEKFEPQSARFKILLDGKEQPDAFIVTQEANTPYLTITPEEGIKLGADARTLSFSIKGSVKYEISETYAGEDADWLTERSISEGGELTYQVLANMKTTARTAKVVVKVPGFESLNTEVSVSQVRTRQALGFPVEWLFSAADMSKYTTDFVNNNFISPESGSGTICYMRNPDNTGTFKKSVGSTGHPTVAGTLWGDYWEFSVPATEDIPANSIAHIKFITRSSAGGPRYWVLEYLDGETWYSFGEKRSTEIENEGTIEYTLDLVEDLLNPKTVGTSNALIDTDLTLQHPIPTGATLQIRYRCVSNRACNGKQMSAAHGGTSRIAGAASGQSTPSPSIDIQRPTEEGLLPQ